eukprot:m.196858 g.196858  ORF g.196858 m.196858 type:complete len:414 (+) comp21843_c0_seq6:108-1349(+)
MSSPMRELVAVLCQASEKAARIARTCRTDEQLLALLTMEKQAKRTSLGEVVPDFKTLADVWIQQVLVAELTKKFPEMASRVFGEEHSRIPLSATESVHLEVLATEDDTTALLLPLLDGNTHAAKILARLAHRDIVDPLVEAGDLAGIEGTFDPATTAVWIDPIDCTASYTQGGQGKWNSGVLVGSGLPAVTVLIGAFNVETGLPIAGVVNQPFYEMLGHSAMLQETVASMPPENTPHRRKLTRALRQDSLVKHKTFDVWSGRCVWGAVPQDAKCTWGCQPRLVEVHREETVAVRSKNESPSLVARCEKTDIQFLACPGAGYKLLSVLEGVADAFFLSGNSTFKWDTCGPHAILLAQGGVLLHAHTEQPVRYHCKDAPTDSDGKYANEGGLMAFTTDKGRNLARTLRELWQSTP